MLNEAKSVSWKEILQKSVTSKEQLKDRFHISFNAISPVAEKYPMRINPYFLALVKTPDDPIGRQIIPDIRELDNSVFTQDDPFSEVSSSPVPHLVHRYPDRVLFLVSGQCAVYCRHCMRKRNAGIGKTASREDVDRVVDYVRSNQGVKEVILSGGDPLLLHDTFLGDILQRFKRISHVARLRIHSRVPCVLPHRITDELVDLLRRCTPLYINIQFNHPDELTHESAKACAALADAGIILGSQTVLLRGVNDDPDVMAELMQKLLDCRVRPYYLHHPDPVMGTAHFSVTVQRGLSIMRALRERISGMGIPQYVMDLPESGGKMPVSEWFAIQNGGRDK